MEDLGVHFAFETLAVPSDVDNNGKKVSTPGEKYIYGKSDRYYK